MGSSFRKMVPRIVKTDLVKAVKNIGSGFFTVDRGSDTEEENKIKRLNVSKKGPLKRSEAVFGGI